MHMEAAQEKLLQIDELSAHPQADHLIDIVTAGSGISSAGFPYISDRAFRVFTEKVPHLFRDGASILSWLTILKRELEGLGEIPRPELESVARAMKVLRNVVYTACVTAPPDLWILKQVLSAHRELGILDWLTSGHILDPEVYAQENGLDVHQLRTDLDFLHARGYLGKGDGDFVASPNPAISAVLESASEIPAEYRRNLVSPLAEGLSTSAWIGEELESWIRLVDEHRPTGSWIASHYEIELGYRVLPIVLSLRVIGVTPNLKQGTKLIEQLPNLNSELAQLFDLAGYTEAGEVSELGTRVFERGPGAFGIIGAYHPYLNQLTELLKSGTSGTWVHRAENVAASQAANRKSFSIANDKLDQFCSDHGFAYTVFIEHAVGRGEAIRQRFERDGEAGVRFFGADLEDAAIDQALQQQELGVLPKNLQFIRFADIGEPRKVTEYLDELGLSGEPTVMMVGNGFHEIRQQTNEKMVEVFRDYALAGYVLIFTEESALHDEALIRTAWNTYHAGFRYVHEMSGQGLRPAVERERSGTRWSWRKCAELAGYRVLDEYGYRSRTIYPYQRPKHKNPAISVTYFCVPQEIAQKLGVE